MEINAFNCSLGVEDILQLIFITLKLCGVIDWNWGIVLIPLWIELGLGLIYFIICGAIAIFSNDEEESEEESTLNINIHVEEGE